MAKQKNGKRSPIKEKPLRYPGQSLDEEIDRVLDEQMIPYTIAILFAWLLTVLTWVWSALDKVPNPFVTTLTAVVVTAYGVYRILRRRTHLENLRLGRDGEKEVGQSLEELREAGCRVFHDIVGEGFNIDHVIIGTGGVYTIETKTYRKPSEGNAKIHYDGRSIQIDGVQPTGDILGQVKAQRKWLADVFQKSTGKKYPVRGVVVFPGWYVDIKGNPSHHEVWVMNSKMLPQFIDNEPKRLETEALHLAAYHLARYIRAVA